MKKVFLLILGTAAFITLIGLYSNGKFDFNPQPTAKDITIDNTTISVEIADTAAKRAKGLSGRSSLDANAGMLFILDPTNISPAFWMKDMSFPLDIIWIKSGVITKIDADVPVPAPGTTDKNLTLYKPDSPVDQVLEVNAGFCFKNHITKGDTVQD